MKKSRWFHCVLLLSVFVLSTASISKEEVVDEQLTCSLTIFKGLTSVCDSNLHRYLTDAGYSSYFWATNNGYSSSTSTNYVDLDVTILCGATYLDVYADCGNGNYTNTMRKYITYCCL